MFLSCFGYVVLVVIFAVLDDNLHIVVIDCLLLNPRLRFLSGLVADFVCKPVFQILIHPFIV